MAEIAPRRTYLLKMKRILRVHSPELKFRLMMFFWYLEFCQKNLENEEPLQFTFGHTQSQA